jgi:hypothetical protein
MKESSDSILAEKVSEDILLDLITVFEKHKWTNKRYKELTNLWNLCDLRAQQELLRDLTLKMEVLNGEEEGNAYNHINEFITQKGFSPENTLIVGCGDVGRAANGLIKRTAADGSFVGLQRMKNVIEPVGDWESRMSQNMIELMEKIKNNDTVLIYDDFIGSGNKILKKYQWLNDLIDGDDNVDFSTITVCFLSLAGMGFGLQHVKDVTKCEVSSYMQLKKGISGQYPCDEVSQKLELMKQLEEKLSENYKDRILTDYTLGYSASECLYFAENDNCPNNVFPIFWWKKLKNGDEHATLLRRSK